MKKDKKSLLDESVVSQALINETIAQNKQIYSLLKQIKQSKSKVEKCEEIEEGNNE